MAKAQIDQRTSPAHDSILRIALWQCAPGTGGDKASVLESMKKICAIARDNQANLVIFPEMFLTGYAIGAELVRVLAEKFDGPSARKAADFAKEYNLSIVYGYPEIDEDSTVYNSANFISGCGVINTYRKKMLFGDVDRAQFSPSNEKNLPVKINGIRFGMAICYDIEFPEVARELALAGAEVVLVPTANMHPYESVADRLLPARAQENGIFVVYANYYGSDDLFEYFGKSRVCDPLGETVASVEAGEHLLLAELDLKRISLAKQVNDYLGDYRAIYSADT